MKNNNDSFPLFLIVFMWIFMFLFIFDDDDKKQSPSQNDIGIQADTKCITAQELVDQKKVDRVITFVPDTDTLLSGQSQVAGCEIHNNRGCVNAGGLYLDNPMTTALLSYHNLANVPMSNVSKQWDSLLRAELVSNRPAYYRGDGNISHAWVCDGLTNSNMYHLNFGWGGYMNGLPSSNIDRHTVVPSKSLGSSKTKVTDTNYFTVPSGYFRGSMSGSELNRLYNAILSANSPGAKMIAYMTEMDKLNKEQEELAKDMDNPPLSAYQEALLYGNIACYIQKNYLPINSVILDIYKDRLSRD